MIVPDEVVIDALLKDAKRFKSKWELHTNEPTRAKPNVKFLKRTLFQVVKTNKDLMRVERPPENRDVEAELNENRGRSSPSSEREPSTSKPSESEFGPNVRRCKKHKHCSKSRHGSPNGNSRSSKKSKHKKERSPSKSRKKPKIDQ